MIETKNILKILSIIAIVAGFIHHSTQYSLSEDERIEPSAFAVVELFTSEGCSSCPPADLLLRDITLQARETRLPIYTLSFHVDYWDYLGWKDPFSSKEFTKRQRRYASVRKSKDVYTPQMVVNGEHAFAGYNLNVAQISIQASLNKPAKASIRLRQIHSNASNLLQVKYKVTGASRNDVLNIAVVERGLVRDVLRGENRGQQLKHDNVVRVFQTVKLRNPDGHVEFEIPESLDRDQSSIVAYVQNSKDMIIKGAERIDL